MSSKTLHFGIINALQDSSLQIVIDQFHPLHLPLTLSLKSIKIYFEEKSDEVGD
jgi:hypothetical protein